MAIEVSCSLPSITLTDPIISSVRSRVPTFVSCKNIILPGPAVNVGTYATSHLTQSLDFGGLTPILTSVDLPAGILVCRSLGLIADIFYLHGDLHPASLSEIRPVDIVSYRLNPNGYLPNHKIHAQYDFLPRLIFNPYVEIVY